MYATHLLKQDGHKTCVESLDTILLCHARHGTRKTLGVTALGNQTNTRGLERREKSGCKHPVRKRANGIVDNRSAT